MTNQNNASNLNEAPDELVRLSEEWQQKVHDLNKSWKDVLEATKSETNEQCKSFLGKMQAYLKEIYPYEGFLNRVPILSANYTENKLAAFSEMVSEVKALGIDSDEEKLLLDFVSVLKDFETWRHDKWINSYKMPKNGRLVVTNLAGGKRTRLL